MEIKNLILKKEINENQSLNRPIDLNHRFTIGNPIPGIED